MIGRAVLKNFSIFFISSEFNTSMGVMRAFAIIVDCLNDAAQDFYTKYAFQLSCHTFGDLSEKKTTHKFCG